MEYEKIVCSCGLVARVVICGVGVYISCPYCGRTTMMHSTKEDAIQDWEKMAKEKALSRQAKDLQKSCIKPSINII